MRIEENYENEASEWVKNNVDFNNVQQIPLTELQPIIEKSVRDSNEKNLRIPIILSGKHSGNNKFLIIDGNHRFFLAQQQNFKTLPAIFAEDIPYYLRKIVITIISRQLYYMYRSSLSEGKLLINEEIEEDFKKTALEFFKDKLKITSKVQLVNGAPNVEAGDKVFDIFFPKAGIFTLEVSADDTFEFIRELAHEMVHVKQIEDKRLKLINPGIVEFEGEEFHVKAEDFKSEDSDTPFDKEANALEKDLASSFWHKLNMKEENITIKEDLRPQHPSISYQYLDTGGGYTSQIILYNGKQIGKVRYDDGNEIMWADVDADHRKKDIYSNALIAYVRQFGEPVVSTNRIDGNAESVWNNLKTQMPNDMKIFAQNVNGKIFYLLALKNTDFSGIFESIEKRSFIKDILTMEQVIKMTSAEDVQDVAEWLKKPAEQIIWQYKQVPSHGFEEQVLSMIGTYKNFPKDKLRTQHIYNILKKGGKPMPIFVDAGDGFILEGRHRVVAFFLMDMPIIPVIYVE